jgi:transposase-like protein
MVDLRNWIEAQDISCPTRLVIDQIANPFSCLFICPAACRNAWQSMRPFLAVDACHCTSRYKQTLFIAVGVDGDNQILPLCWGIAQGENFQDWLLFLQFVKSSLYGNDIFDEADAQTRATLVIMIDRQKALKALQEIFQGASMAHCTQHIAANIQSRYGIAARELW